MSGQTVLWGRGREEEDSWGREQGEVGSQGREKEDNQGGCGVK